MRRFQRLIPLVLVLCTSALWAQEKTAQDTTNFAQMQFETSAFDFKVLHQGEKMTRSFEFKNTGNLPLIVQNVLTTCGCTVPEWPTEPVAPGATGQIKVIFDSTAKIGRQNKVITIRSNAKSGDVHLRISGMVLPPEKK